MIVVGQLCFQLRAFLQWQSREIQDQKFRWTKYQSQAKPRFSNNKKGQLSLTNPRDACEKFARFT